MREIKFRFFDKEKNYMAYAGPETGLTDGDLLDYGMKAGYPVMQFTGLRDKNGVKIFCGDIVCMKWIKTEYIGEVKFFNGAFSVNGCIAHFGQMYASCSEILGNIHQHPHLLEQKK